MVYKTLAFLMVGSVLACTPALAEGILQPVAPPHMIVVQVTKGREALKLTHRGGHEKVGPDGVQWLIADNSIGGMKPVQPWLFVVDDRMRALVPPDKPIFQHGMWVLGLGEKVIEHNGDQTKEYDGTSQVEVAQKQK